MADLASLAAKPAFAAHIAALAAAPPDAGVIVREHRDPGLATVLTRRGQAEALAARVRDLYGIDLPTRPARAEAGGTAFVATGPAAWLAVREGGGNGFARDLARDLGDLASVSDQSDGYAVLRLGGRDVRAALARGLAIDLHPRRFTTGDAAASTIEHVGVIVWQVSEAPEYDIALFRSLAGSFWHWLVVSSAEFGLAAARG